MGIFDFLSGSKSGDVELMRKGAGCQPAPEAAPEGKEYATFAGGCFWGMELAYQRVPGIEQTTVGYTQGRVENPTYEMVCTGATGHTEGVLCVYDPKETSFEQLMDAFLERVDVTALNRQGNDVGTQYRNGVYYHNEEQKAIAEKKLAERAKELGRKVVTEVQPAGLFYVAEGYHQQYLEKGGRMGRKQSAAKGCTDPIRCYG